MNWAGWVLVVFYVVSFIRGVNWIINGRKAMLPVAKYPVTTLVVYSVIFAGVTVVQVWLFAVAFGAL